MFQNSALLNVLNPVFLPYCRYLRCLVGLYMAFGIALICYAVQVPTKLLLTTIFCCRPFRRILFFGSELYQRDSSRLSIDTFPYKTMLLCLCPNKGVTRHRRQRRAYTLVLDVSRGCTARIRLASKHWQSVSLSFDGYIHFRNFVFSPPYVLSSRCPHPDSVPSVKMLHSADVGNTGRQLEHLADNSR